MSKFHFHFRACPETNISKHDKKQATTKKNQKNKKHSKQATAPAFQGVKPPPAPLRPLHAGVHELPEGDLVVAVLVRLPDDGVQVLVGERSPRASQQPFELLAVQEAVLVGVQLVEQVLHLLHAVQ